MTTSLQGFGLGLRREHYRDFVDAAPRVDWLEILTENYLVPGGKPLHFLDRIRCNYPMVMHGVSLSIGTTEPLDMAYLAQVKALAEHIEPAWISDHLCWTGAAGLNLHDLLPMPYTRAALKHLTSRLQAVQEYLGRPLLMENVSSYVSYAADEMSEWEFIGELVRNSGCKLLLDVNNIYVSSVNHGFEPRQFVDAMPADAICQIHLAGHEDHGSYIIDTHDHPVCDAVWDLYDYTVRRLGAVPTMIERDDNIPGIDELIAELDAARTIAQRALQVTESVA